MVDVEPVPQGNVYTALAAALEHERACYETYLSVRDRAGGIDRNAAHERWEDARSLITQLREQIAVGEREGRT